MESIATEGAELDIGTVASRTEPKTVIVYGMNHAPELAGVGRYTGDIVDYLSHVGMEVVVVTTPPHYPGWAVQNGFRNRYSTETNGNVRVIRTPLLLRRQMRGIWRLLAPLTFAISSTPVIMWQIIRRRPDAVFCVEPTLFAAPMAQFAAWISGSKTILHVQDLEIDAAFAVGHLGRQRWIKSFAYFMEKRVLRRFDRIITISLRMAANLEAKGVDQQKVDIIRNWVDLSHIYPLDGDNSYRASLNFSAQDFVVLYSGNIGAKQGLDVLLDAAALLEEEGNIRFVVAGEGPVKAQLQETYKGLTNVTFLPLQPYEQLNEFLNFADVHALPQDRNAADLVLPSKLGGMLASGKPVIATADTETELADFLGDGAILTEPGNPKALADAIRQTRDGKLAVNGERVSELGRQLSRTSNLSKLARIVEFR
ncbi:WcaI family glycosyltransferase [Aliirhizobium smilacinae]|uniref:Colanic acid biosynthesis glycosyltransferase WcaI n=1 Tax=Aliirhizobium smilacinae TaxID=1395944 RepID=A0A5C4XPF9_9HYPH|nr:WcaI family glycosyltransferase [Rhizobium smilacinae]TNM65322.1 colanic acid biosynthesis glycosyltransferase WcaI [Rhizobium smilacinae]